MHTEHKSTRHAYYRQRTLGTILVYCRLCMQNLLVLVLKALEKRATKGLSLCKPATVLSVTSTEKTAIDANLTVKCQ